ncbi:TPA: small nuclear ribonucleoprotein (Sm) [Candidatus Bathyarchaeota archaeon]|nr:small nuclear ribonucleoprotein (Sm) [Candidatus Bathyarchaeota archaeon]
MSSVAAKRFFEEFAGLLQRPVTAVTADGKQYSGTLVGFDPSTLSVCLSDVVDESGKKAAKMFLYGGSLSKIYTLEKPFDLRKLAERLDRVFPRMVKIYEEAGVITVTDRIRVTASGIVEGTGPMAERVQRIYEEFVKEISG